MDVMLWIIAVFAAVVGMFLGHAFTPRRQPRQKPPKLPEKTEHEVKNDDADDHREAAEEAADNHGVPVSVVDDALEWLESGDV